MNWLVLFQATRDQLNFQPLDVDLTGHLMQASVNTIRGFYLALTLAHHGCRIWMHGASGSYSLTVFIRNKFYNT